LLVPAYFDPGPSWREALTAGRGSVEIMNPDSGPGAQLDRGYRTVVSAARRAGVRLVAYVATGYGHRPASAIEGDIDRYRRWYGVRDVFFDEAASDARDVARYRTLTGYARQHGATLVVLNCGVVPDRRYFDIADMVVTFEDTYSAYIHARFPSWLRGYRPSHQAHIIIDAVGTAAARHALALSRRRGAGFAFVTDRSLPNPYGALPTYFRKEASWKDA
jgi:hypothetical protein